MANRIYHMKKYSGLTPFQDHEQQHQKDAAQINAEQRAKILALASDFPKLWNDSRTTDRDRKRMARLLLEDVTLRRDGEILVQVRFKGGSMRELRLPPPKTVGKLKKTRAEIVSEIGRLSEQHTDGQIAHMLHERGWCSSGGCRFTLRIVNRLRRDYHVKGLGDRLRAEGWLTVREVAVLLECEPSRVNYWRKIGLLVGRRFSDRKDYLYQRPSQDVVAEIKIRQHRDRWKMQNSGQLV